MANLGGKRGDHIVGTFRIEKHLWSQFETACSQVGCSRGEALRDLVKLFNKNEKLGRIHKREKLIIEGD